MNYNEIKEDVMSEMSCHDQRFCFYQEKKASSMLQEDVRDMLEKTCKRICITTIVVSPDPLV